MSKQFEPVVSGDRIKGDGAQLSHLLCLVGKNVRTARSRAGMSRRALSRISHVSERYLAQLESGKGNISIGLLLKIATALDIRIEQLVAEESLPNSEFALARCLWSKAGSEQRHRVLEILQPDQINAPRANRIALIGLRGAGKSTLGARAAKKMAVNFLELNSEIEGLSGMPVHEVFALYDHQGYRRLERQALTRIVEVHDKLILAVAGGIVSEPETCDYLFENYHTIWLRAKPEDHMARVRGQGDTRPMAGHPNAMDNLRNILTSRERLYAKADAQLDTSNAALDDSLQALLEIIKTRGFLGDHLIEPA